MAGAVGIHGMFAASALVALVGTIVLGFAVSGTGIGSVRSPAEITPTARWSGNRTSSADHPAAAG